MRTAGSFLILLTLCLAPAALAQNDCPALIAAALNTVDSACNSLERNELCYGNITLNATPRANAENTDFQFEQSGDVVGIADIQSLQLSSFDQTDGEWGVALMKVQANLPDTLPGQNVTFLLFGNVSLSDAGDQIVEVEVTATSAVNVRQRPGTDAAVVGALPRGQTVTATGRLPDSTWIRVRLNETTAGWVSADFVEGDLPRLLATEPDAPEFGPMQAFSFSTGIGDAPCAEAPASGILIQTPEGDVSVTLRANQVDIRLGSTVYLQAAPGDAMYVHVIDGHATLDAFGESQVVPAGTVATVPLAADGAASGAPAFPETYESEVLQTLPLHVGLPDTVSVQPGIREASIPGAIDIANGLPPREGRWRYTQTTTHIPDPLCGIGQGLVQGLVETLSTRIIFSEDRATATFRDLGHEIGGVGDVAALVLYRTGEATYTGSYFSGDWEITFDSLTSFSGNTIGWQENHDCSWDREYAGEYLP